MTFEHKELVELVRLASADVFTTMLAMDLTVGEPFVDSSPDVVSNGVVSLIGLAGAWVGNGSIACTASFACRMASELMMAKYDSVNDDVLDAVAEVTNMIIGNVKTTLEDRLGPMGLSIPTVIYGRNFSSRTIGKQSWTVVPFQVDGETLAVQLCLAPNRDIARLRWAFPAEAGAQG